MTMSSENKTDRLSNEDLDRLEALAEAAGPEAWSVSGVREKWRTSYSDHVMDSHTVGPDDGNGWVAMIPYDPRRHAQDFGFAQFIAAFDPPTVLKLIAQARLAARTEEGGELVAEIRALTGRWSRQADIDASERTDDFDAGYESGRRAAYQFCISDASRLADALEARPLQGQPSLPEGWRPIETAPKDGTDILLFCPQGDGGRQVEYRVTEGHWHFDPGGVWEHRDLDGRWIGQDESDGFEGWLSWDGGFSEETMMPTHWMPLPSPPAPDSVAPSGEDSAGSDSVSRQSRATSGSAKLEGEP